MFTPFVFNLLGILVYTVILIPKCPWVLPVFAVMSIMNILLERKISVKGYRKYRDVVGETDSRTDYFFQRSTSATDGKDIRLFQMEGWFTSVMEFLIRKRLRVWKRIEVAYFVPNFSDTVWTLVRDIIAYTVLVNIFLQDKLDAATFTLYLGVITGFAGWLNGGNMGDGFVRANSEMMRCSWWISSYCSFLDLWSPYGDEETAQREGENTADAKEKSEGIQNRNCELSYINTDTVKNGVTIEFRDVCFRYPDAQKDVIHHLNLKVQAGENIALVGVNGAGKTTLVKLLCGFYRPDSGQILVNGRDVSEYSANQYRIMNI